MLVAAGDIATCDGQADEATANLLANVNGTVVTLGDNAYPNGSENDFAECYDPTWGRQKLRTEPTPGNHEYYTRQAEGYFSYFGEAAHEPNEGYYSYDVGRWHVVALNSNCKEIGGCEPSSPQIQWLESDLEKNQELCTLAYFHHPLFSSGKYRPGVPEMKPLWEALYAAGADVVLNGHDHNYQRFTPQDPEGKADPERGIRQFVVGTGGAGLYSIQNPLESIETYNDSAHGVLKLALHTDKYDWEFIPVKGKSFTDTGSARCH
ncbi:MAG: metallophosphoesterase [Actinomycetota bacterium]|nr:metallophosphoesterase [Actinomycetota bacterium]